jgi:hypothetical protein
MGKWFFNIGALLAGFFAWLKKASPEVEAIGDDEDTKEKIDDHIRNGIAGDADSDVCGMP